MIEKRKKYNKKAIWPIKSNLNPSIRISKKRSGYTNCAYCNKKILENEIAYLIYPNLSTSGLWIHFGCIEALFNEMQNLKNQNIKKLISEQLCLK